MSNLIIIIIATFVILLGTSIYFQKRNSPLRYIVPIIGLLISLVLIGISFIIGNWEGLGIGAVGFSIFIGSALAFIITAIIANAKELKKNIR